MNTEIFDLGKIGITLAGEYNNKVIYEKLTIVLYKGKSYISTKTTQNISPEEDIHSWQLVAEAKDAYHMLVDAGKTTLTEEEFLEQLVDTTKGRYIIQGNVINAADEEDLTVEHSSLLGIDTLKLANRPSTDGMGYVILRKNKSFAEQVTKENTIYEIRYDFTLDEDITIPANCILEFNGGSISGDSSNTLNLNQCNIFGRGLRCLISNPYNNNLPLSAFLSDISNSILNRQVIQVLVDALVPVINDYSETIELDDYISVKSKAVVKGGKWNFPNSRGFVWDKKGSSCAYSYFDDIEIITNSHCFDFVNDDNENHPNNVYWSKFKNINATSTNGDCFTAGQDNKGYDTGPSQCVFDNYFENITVNSPNGCGFKGINGNTHYFVKCNCVGAGEAFFFNCAGVFDCCNSTFISSSTAFKGRGATNSAINLKCIFINCNFEEYNNGNTIFDCNDIRCYCYMQFINCSFYIYPDNDNKIQHYILDFQYLYNLVFKGSVILNVFNASYDTNYSFIRLRNTDTCKIETDIDLLVSDINNYVTKVPSSYTCISNGLLINTYNKFPIEMINNIRSSYIECNYIRKRETVLEKTNEVLNISTLAEFICIKVPSSQDIQENKYFNYMQIPDFIGTNSESIIGFTFIIKNICSKANIIFKYTYGYNNTFKNIDGSANLILAPNEVAICNYNVSAKCVYMKKYVSDDNKQVAGVTADRPGNPTIGTCFFDTSTGIEKPIWYKGNNVWVDSSGSVVE